MKTFFLPKPMAYLGPELNGLFAYKHLRTAEDSLITFTGPAEVREHLVDYEDKLANDFIKAENMLHFILTVHGNDLVRGRLWQLLLAQSVLDVLKEMVSST